MKWSLFFEIEYQFRVSKIKDIEDFFAEISNREKMNKILSYITALDYADRILLILSGASSDVSLF